MEIRNAWHTGNPERWLQAGTAAVSAASSGSVPLPVPKPAGEELGGSCLWWSIKAIKVNQA
jgi:hypothetical protein